MRVQHVAIDVGHTCIVSMKVGLHNKEFGKCAVSVGGGVPFGSRPIGSNTMC